jgi:hypothetical protein
VIQGNHVHSGLHTAEGYTGSHSLHLRASGGGDNGANRAKIKLTSGFTPGETVTIRAKARWLAGHTNLLLRLKGNYLEAVGAIAPPPRGGTPGAANTRAVANAGPAIHSVTHTPGFACGWRNRAGRRPSSRPGRPGQSPTHVPR